MIQSIHEELHDHNEENKNEYKISYSLDEIRPLIIREIPTAQDPTGMFNLSNLKIFKYYHELLEDYLKGFNPNKPTMAEKLAFLCLLSYPEQKIREAESFDCFKLFTDNQNKDSDFEIIEIIDSEYNEQDEHTNERYDCICSYQKLKKVFKVENLYTGITLYVGCDCIKTYCIVSKKELTEKNKEMDEIRKKNRDRKREIEEGLPLGYYKEQKIQEKIKKLQEKELKKREKEDEKINTGNYRRCYECDISVFNIRNNKNQRFCENICFNKNKLFNMICNINYTFKYYYDKNWYNRMCEICYCVNCDVEFVAKRYEKKYLCHLCEKEKKILNCNWCDKEFLDSIESNDKYCSECDKFMTACIDCNIDFKKTNTDRCNLCNYKYENKTIIVNCEECENEFPRKQNQNNITYCLDCYKIKINNPPICKCGKEKIARTTKKDSPNKGRQFFCCPTNPGCRNSFEWL
jgi:hypothetical protein